MSLGDTRFNCDTQQWECDSLSSLNESSNHKRLGDWARPINVELSISDISPSGCELGGPSNCIVQQDSILRLIEPLPSHKTALNESAGCVYSSDSMPFGYSEREVTNVGGRNRTQISQVHYLSHTRSAHVHTRHCSLGHKECEILYTGRADGFHRQTTATMVRHEVLLFFWYITKNMRGPGAHAYGKMVEELHRLGGQEPHGHYRTLFIQADALRASFFGYLARQR